MPEIVAMLCREDCAREGVEPEYDRLLSEGHEPGFAAMLALKQAPVYSGSDRGFLEGDLLGHGIKEFPLWMQEDMVAKARQAGVSVSGKVYKSQLASYPGDPRAWVGSRDDVKDVCNERNMLCDGKLTRNGHTPDPTPDVPLSEKSIQSLSKEYIAENPDWARKPEELRDKVINTHGAAARFKGSKNPKPKGRLPKLPGVKTRVDE